MSTLEQTNRNREEILIVEDSPTQARRLQFILEQQGYNVTAAENGRRAIEAAQRRKPTLIISDVVMPEMNGYELCSRVKSDPALADVPVILVTTMSNPEDVIRGLECRADHFILKPYDERYLLGRVHLVVVNREVRQTDQPGMGLEIYFNGKKHFIAADRLQILNLLLSTYDAAIQRNKELTGTQDKLREANKGLEAFTHSVSHDLRAPLRHIAGFTELLGRSESSLSQKGKHCLEQISSAADRMGHLIEDLLEFSRMGQAEMRRIPVSLDELRAEVLRNIAPELEGRNIQWVNSPLPRVLGDPAMLRQVFQNLLLNAVKYSRGRDPAVIESGCREQTDEDVTIFVKDNGVGFDMKFAQKLFGVFQRLHSAAEFEGTGVGLANVRQIVARHGGETWAEGKLGEGACFYFKIPLTRDSD